MNMADYAYNQMGVINPNSQYGGYVNTDDIVKKLQESGTLLPTGTISQNWQNPFSTASAGMTAQGGYNQQGGQALQNYINRMTQNANSALFAGNNYRPMGLLSGNVTGNAQQFQAPQQTLQGLLGSFGNRSWMRGG